MKQIKGVRDIIEERYLYYRTEAETTKLSIMQGFYLGKMWAYSHCLDMLNTAIKIEESEEEKLISDMAKITGENNE